MSTGTTAGKVSGTSCVILIGYLVPDTLLMPSLRRIGYHYFYYAIDGEMKRNPFAMKGRQNKMKYHYAGFKQKMNYRFGIVGSRRD